MGCWWSRCCGSTARPNNPQPAAAPAQGVAAPASASGANHDMANAHNMDDLSTHSPKSGSPASKTSPQKTHAHGKDDTSDRQEKEDEEGSEQGDETSSAYSAHSQALTGIASHNQGRNYSEDGHHGLSSSYNGAGSSPNEDEGVLPSSSSFNTQDASEEHSDDKEARMQRTAVHASRGEGGPMHSFNRHKARITDSNSSLMMTRDSDGHIVHEDEGHSDSNLTHQGEGSPQSPRQNPSNDGDSLPLIAIPLPKMAHSRYQRGFQAHRAAYSDAYHSSEDGAHSHAASARSPYPGSDAASSDATSPRIRVRPSKDVSVEMGEQDRSSNLQTPPMGRETSSKDRTPYKQRTQPLSFHHELLEPTLEEMGFAEEWSESEEPSDAISMGPSTAPTLRRRSPRHDHGGPSQAKTPFKRSTSSPAKLVSRQAILPHGQRFESDYYDEAGGGNSEEERDVEFEYSPSMTRHERALSSPRGGAEPKPSQEILSDGEEALVSSTQSVVMRGMTQDHFDLQVSEINEWRDSPVGAPLPGTLSTNLAISPLSRSEEEQKMDDENEDVFGFNSPLPVIGSGPGIRSNIIKGSGDFTTATIMRVERPSLPKNTLHVFGNISSDADDDEEAILGKLEYSDYPIRRVGTLGRSPFDTITARKRLEKNFDGLSPPWQGPSNPPNSPIQLRTAKADKRYSSPFEPIHLGLNGAAPLFEKGFSASFLETCDPDNLPFAEKPRVTWSGSGINRAALDEPQELRNLKKRHRNPEHLPPKPLFVSPEATRASLVAQMAARGKEDATAEDELLDPPPKRLSPRSSIVATDHVQAASKYFSESPLGHSGANKHSSSLIQSHSLPAFLGTQTPNQPRNNDNPFKGGENQEIERLELVNTSVSLPSSSFALWPLPNSSHLASERSTSPLFLEDDLGESEPASFHNDTEDDSYTWEGEFQEEVSTPQPDIECADPCQEEMSHIWIGDASMKPRLSDYLKAGDEKRYYNDEDWFGGEGAAMVAVEEEAKDAAFQGVYEFNQGTPVDVARSSRATAISDLRPVYHAYHHWDVDIPVQNRGRALRTRSYSHFDHPTRSLASLSPRSRAKSAISYVRYASKRPQ